MEHRSSDAIWNTTVDERRQSARFPKEPGADSAVVWQQPGREMLVYVHDESLHSICVVITEVSTLKVGATATIVYHSDVLDGTVRRIASQPDGSFLVGFECR
jgi:hypothetical protein